MLHGSEWTLPSTTSDEVRSVRRPRSKRTASFRSSNSELLTRRALGSSGRLNAHLFLAIPLRTLNKTWINSFRVRGGTGTTHSDNSSACVPNAKVGNAIFHFEQGAAIRAPNCTKLTVPLSLSGHGSLPLPKGRRLRTYSLAEATVQET